MTASSISMLKTRSRCPACTSPSTVPLLSLPYDAAPIKDFIVSHYGGRANIAQLTGEVFEVLQCGACNLIFQKNIPSDSLLKEIYDAWIPPSERERLRREKTLGDYRYLTSQVEFLIQYFNLRPFEISVFDFGLGWSEWACVAQSYGCEVAGSELSVERMDYARSRGIRLVDWNNIPSENFHFINTEQVFEHLIEPLETLKHLIRGLQHKGIIKISVPNGHGMRNRLKQLETQSKVTRDSIMPVQPLEHVNCFDYRSLVNFGTQAGLKVVKPSLRLLYNGASGWFEPKQGFKNFFRPIYRHIYPKSTFVYFSKVE